MRPTGIILTLRKYVLVYQVYDVWVCVPPKNAENQNLEKEKERKMSQNISSKINCLVLFLLQHFFDVMKTLVATSYYTEKIFLSINFRPFGKCIDRNFTEKVYFNFFCVFCGYLLCDLLKFYQCKSFGKRSYRYYNL